MFLLGDLPRVAWQGKEEGRIQTIGWDPKKRKWHLLPVSEKKNKKNQLLDRVLVRRNQSQYSG